MNNTSARGGAVLLPSGETDAPGGNNIASLLTPKVFLAYVETSFTLRQCLEKMRHHGFTAMPVVTEDGSYAGTVNEGDFLWNILDSGARTLKEQEKTRITAILRQGWNPPVKIDATMEELLERVTEQNFVPVIDDRGKFVGIVTRKSVIQRYCRLRSERARFGAV